MRRVLGRLLSKWKEATVKLIERVLFGPAGRHTGRVLNPSLKPLPVPNGKAKPKHAK